MLKQGDTIGPYTLRESRGKGTFGEVWKATKEDAPPGTFFALKIPWEHQFNINDYLKEVQTWSRCGKHPNVQPLLDAQSYGNRFVFVTEFAPDGSMADWLENHRGEAPSQAEAVRIVCEILKGVEHLHHLDILHRDLKPANILLYGGTPRITDLGLARFLDKSIYRSAAGKGTPAYMAPEVQSWKASRVEYTKRCDLYSVGVILCQCLTGYVPWPVLDESELQGLPVALRSVVCKALERDPKNRYQFAGEMRKALEACNLTVNPRDGAEMIWIPAGPFLMGDDDQSDNPRHTVMLSGYWMYKNLVTVEQYRAYDLATGSKYDWAKKKPSWGWLDDHPMVNVVWDQARGYCRWSGGDLPTEAQYEKAARGTSGLKYPWGNDWDASLCANSVKTNDLYSTVSVGSYPAGKSPYGCLDMSGNVWEWCLDWYDGDYWKSNHGTDPPGPKSGTCRVLRGGSWNGSYPVDFRAAYRDYYDPTDWDDCNGFRCVVRAGSS